MAVETLKIVYRNPSLLKGYAKNSRTHSEDQVRQIRASIEEFGFTNPILLRDDGVTIGAGHGRQAAALLDPPLKKVPTIILAGLTDAQWRAYVIADNKLGLNAGWDTDLLQAELLDLKSLGFDLNLTGFDLAEIDELFRAPPSDRDQEAIPPVPKVATSSRGDQWVLGDHRLRCGDSTNGEDVKALMNGRRAKLFATDPPYSVGYDGTAHPQSKTNKPAVANKDWSGDYNEAGKGEDAFYLAFYRAAIEHALDPRAAWYCWHATLRQAMLESVWVELGAFVHQQIIWVKSRPVLTYSAYMWQHEPCLFGWIKGNKPRTKTKGMEYQTTVWQVPNSEIGSADHPTSKPVTLFRVPIEAHTARGDLCYEAFSGSGTHIIAAEATGRHCYAMEISPVFTDVGVARWQDFTGQEAILEETGETFREVQARRLAGTADAA